ncbi:MAG: DUF5698 domain-containing protein [Oscillospiraceae bacterium]|nr:DUF5698 domain-containing protein [Oscillospiraceae bacterium]
MPLLLLCLQIFFSRIIDVSLGTIRTIMTVRGRLKVAALIGFVEVSIWFLVARTAINSSEGGIAVTLAFAAGFATGTFIGGNIANKFINSILSLQVVTSSKNEEIIKAIRDGGFAVSVLDVNSSEFSAEKYLLLIEIKSDMFKKVQKIIYDKDPGAFIMARETKFVQNGFLK